MTRQYQTLEVRVDFFRDFQTQWFANYSQWTYENAKVITRLFARIRMSKVRLFFSTRKSWKESSRSVRKPTIKCFDFVRLLQCPQKRLSTLSKFIVVVSFCISLLVLFWIICRHSFVAIMSLQNAKNFHSKLWKRFTLNSDVSIIWYS